MATTLKRMAILCFAALLATAGCSSDGANDNGAGTGLSTPGTSGGTSGGGCKDQFCLEDNQNIHVDPSTLVFSDLAPGTEQTLEFSILNTGDRGTLTIQSPAITPANPEFEVLDAKGENIPPQSHVKWKVRYKPTLSGQKQHFVILANNATDKSKQQFKVTLRVQAGAGVLIATPDPVEFGAVASLTTKTKSTKVFNQGEKPVKIESLQLDPNGAPDFKLGKHTQPPFDLAPKQSFEVPIDFTPSKGGIDATHLLIGHSNGQTLSVAVNGEEIGPLIAVVPSQLNYGQLADGAKQTKSFKIFSKGKADLHISKIELDPTSTYKNIFLNESGPLTMKPDASQVVDVELTADKTLPKQSAEVARVLIHSDDPNVQTVKVPIKVQAEPCVAGSANFSVKANLAKGQVDIILVVDSSGSMKEEKKAVSDNLNAFAKDIVAKNIDHHVILIGQGMCVPPPLAGPGCSDSGQFKHVNVKVGSTDALQKVVDTYSQWQNFLRAGAQVHFIVITDDNSKKDGNWFAAELTKLKNPGFGNFFTFHSIVGWSQANESLKLPCFGAAAWPYTYIDLTQKTGGVLESICSKDIITPPDWSAVFAKIGQNVAAKVKVVCTYQLPKEKDGKAVDPATVSLAFQKSDGSPGNIPRVDDKDKCPASSHGWYYDNAQSPTAAVLCPSTCKQLEGKALSFHFGC